MRSPSLQMRKGVCPQLYQLSVAAVTHDHKLSGLKHIYFLAVLEVRSSKIKESAGLCSFRRL